MHDENFAGACAVADLVARLRNDVAQATAELAATEQLYQQALLQLPMTAAVPFRLRRELGSRRRQLSAFQSLLAGVSPRLDDEDATDHRSPHRGGDYVTNA